MNQSIFEIPRIDPQILQSCLEVAAPIYEDWREKGKNSLSGVAISEINAKLDECGIDATNARAFAHGVGVTFATFWKAAQFLTRGDLRSAALLMTEALVRCGDVTPEMINAAIAERRENEQIVREAATEGMQVIRRHLGAPIAPGSIRNN